MPHVHLPAESHPRRGRVSPPRLGPSPKGKVWTNLVRSSAEPARSPRRPIPIGFCRRTTGLINHWQTRQWLQRHPWVRRTGNVAAKRATVRGRPVATLGPSRGQDVSWDRSIPVFFFLFLFAILIVLVVPILLVVPLVFFLVLTLFVFFFVLFDFFPLVL